MSGPARSRAAFSEAAFGALRAATGEGQGEALRIPLADIDEDPGQPRTVFDDDGLAELAASIREHGVVQPVVVRPPVDGRYTLAVGARRLRASRLAGLADIPAVIRRGGGDAFAAQVIENQQRAALSNGDLAAAIARLAGAGHSNRQIATICALKDYQVAAFKQAGHFPPELRARLDRGDMRALYDLYRQWRKTPGAVIAALAEAEAFLTVTEARRIIGGITGAPTGSLVLERPVAARPTGDAVAAAPGPAADGGLHGARPAAPETGRRGAAGTPDPAADAPRGAPVFRVATGDGRTGRLVVDRKAARPGAALVTFSSGTEAVDAAELRIVGVD
ncbi:ParB/RepB/Spo0J family partition protein [Azospirillum sp.]|uniref:ParB/RepB/Spo0J family partition protein n=1 Tax=Azospirillum sp. TaxID=34012 RepID=UPI002D7639E9|nr:ParB/RepB/Spo0J family partition protein [Azospirillum sp.]HYD70755.1 ParB/RepB/Spo0J family partition protein [Azospirillum sp.]